MRITLSPFDSPSFPSKITFTTTHVLPGRTLPKDFPHILDSASSQKWMKPLLDRIILQTENSYFLRSFCSESYADRFDRYSDPSQRAIDFGIIQKKISNYGTFEEFTDDIKLMLNHVIDRSSAPDPIHKEALKLSYYICEHLKKIESDPSASPFEDSKTDREIETAVEAKIESTIHDLQKKKKESEKGSKSFEGSRYKETQRQSKKITESELDDLVKNIKQLKTSSLIGVVEIIENKPFSESLLPIQLNLKHLEEKKVDIKKLKAYVDYCKEGNGQYYYSWKPNLPNELQELHDKYEAKLADWLKPPLGYPEPGVI